MLLAAHTVATIKITSPSITKNTNGLSHKRIIENPPKKNIKISLAIKFFVVIIVLFLFSYY